MRKFILFLVCVAVVCTETKSVVELLSDSVFNPSTVVRTLVTTDGTGVWPENDPPVFTTNSVTSTLVMTNGITILLTATPMTNGTVQLYAEASTEHGFLNKFEFFQDGVMIGTVTNLPPSPTNLRVY